MSKGILYKLAVGHIAHESSAMQMSMLRFKDLVEKESSRRIEVTIFPNGQQGGEVEMLQKVQENTVQAALIPPMVTSNICPVMKVLSLPYIFRNVGNVKDFIGSSISHEILKSLESVRLVGLGYQYNDFFSLFVSTKSTLSSIQKLGDIKGQIFRAVESPLCMEIFKALGFNPLPLPFPKLYDAFLEGQVEGCDGIISVMQPLPIHRCFKSITLSRHMLGIPIFMISKIFFDGLMVDLRNIILDSAKAALNSIFEEEVVNRQRDNSIGFFREKGVEVIELDDHEMKNFIETTKKVHKQYEAVIGKKILRSVYDICGH